MIYPEQDLAQVAIIDVCELLYWSAHERMTDTEWGKMIEDKREAVATLHMRGYSDAEIREMWVSHFKPLYRSSGEKVRT